MKDYSISIQPFGERAILIEWPKEVSESILRDILTFRDSFNKLRQPGWEMSIAYNSITLVNNQEDVDFEEVEKQILDCYVSKNAGQLKEQRFLWHIPVCYEAEFGIDLKDVAKELKLSPEELIGLHTSHEYLVYGIGFLPGFMYLGGLPKTLEIPRRKEPRLAVAKGAVGLAGKQTGIYPQDSPGGWNIIGNCPIPIFDSSKEKPCFVNVGDKIQFYQISKAAYDLHKIEAEVGIFKLEKTPLDA
ncbi:5-oxoprolinase subunit PxpB [Flagellimonas onchidii]|uniref:5-oxoprolinase subunit PxpB n=1 Tax=Flagellimonas onchidii TaxID=2562684 RepID=UPI0010A6B648|nr:5-oxoprolinase subunit PxpB [Allomuricauda onchidii]